MNTHYFASQVTAHIAESPWSDRVETIHEEVLLGTGGSICANADFFGNGSFIVAHADNLTCFDLAGFLDRHRTRPPGTHITMVTFTSDDPASCGIVEEDSEGIVRAFHEKVQNPPGNHANGAIYLFDQVILAYMKDMKKRVIDISTEILPSFIGQINTFHNDDYLRDIGTPEMLQRAEEDILKLRCT